MTNIIVTKTVNSVEWSVDRTSYGRALKAVKSIKAAHEKPAQTLRNAQKRFRNQAALGRGGNPGSPRFKTVSEEVKRQRLQIQMEKRLNTIRAKGIRFSTATNGYKPGRLG